ncbi:hypothetical protein [Halosimplex salinum]|uniref:hypothetical protein n=1 Tax=Halosimplex salinum TaxID=1710538 RepID=UPI0013DE183A|nr:hypothetical protein [Halosimplex salinum]
MPYLEGMERGAEWERRAVRERWAELERQRRAAKLLQIGAVLGLCGLVLTLAALPTSACVQQGPWPHGCTAVVPFPSRALFLVSGPAAVAAGLWLCWRAFRE